MDLFSSYSYSMLFWMFLIYAVIGSTAGFCAGLLGIGGGIVTVPALAFFFSYLGFPKDYIMQLAIGTSLASMVLTTSVATWIHHKAGRILWNIVFLMAPGLFIGAFFGSQVADILSDQTLKLLFGGFLIAIGIFTVVFKRKKDSSCKSSAKELSLEAKKKKGLLYRFFSFIIGFLASLFGVSGGIFTIPFLLSQGYPEKKAMASAAAISCFIVSLSSIAYFYFGSNEKIELKGALGYIYLPAFCITGVFSLIFTSFGGGLAGKTKDTHLRSIFASLLLVAGIFMIFNPM